MMHKALRDFHPYAKQTPRARPSIHRIPMSPHFIGKDGQGSTNLKWYRGIDSGVSSTISYSQVPPSLWPKLSSQWNLGPQPTASTTQMPSQTPPPTHTLWLLSTNFTNSLTTVLVPGANGANSPVGHPAVNE